MYTYVYCGKWTVPMYGHMCVHRLWDSISYWIWNLLIVLDLLGSKAQESSCLRLPRTVIIGVWCSTQLFTKVLQMQTYVLIIIQQALSSTEPFPQAKHLLFSKGRFSCIPDWHPAYYVAKDDLEIWSTSPNWFIPGLGIKSRASCMLDLVSTKLHPQLVCIVLR